MGVRLVMLVHSAIYILFESEFDMDLFTHKVLSISFNDEMDAVILPKFFEGYVYFFDKHKAYVDCNKLDWNECKKFQAIISKAKAVKNASFIYPCSLDNTMPNPEISGDIFYV